MRWRRAARRCRAARPVADFTTTEDAALLARVIVNNAALLHRVYRSGRIPAPSQWLSEIRRAVIALSAIERDALKGKKT